MRKLPQKGENQQPSTHSGRAFDKSGIIGSISGFVKEKGPPFLSAFAWRPLFAR
jgi:hypothetical protein